MRTRTKAIAGAAAALAAAGMFAVTPMASASDGYCTGRGVIYCITSGAAHGYSWGWASIKDADGGYNYNVKVTNLKVQRYYDGSWHTIRHDNDYDGWWSSREEAETDFSRCNSRPHRAVALMSWRRVGSSHVTRKWVAGPSQRC